MTPPTTLEADYERVLATLGTLISGRSRGDGRAWEWEHAMEVMDMCLEVSEGEREREREREAFDGCVWG